MKPQLLLLLSLGVLLGCNHQQGPPPADNEPPTIPVSKPVVRTVTEYSFFTGRTDAVETVSIRARVTGYLTRIAFKEGDVVKKGQLLFVIDPAPYQAQLEQAEAQVQLYQSQYKLAQTTYERDRAVLASGGRGTITQQEVDQDRAAMEEAQAQVKAAQATVAIYKLNVGYTQVTSPIDGQVSRTYFTVGNLVQQDQTVLTTVVSQEPMYAYFDLDEPTLLDIRRAINEGRIKRRGPGNDLPVEMGLQGEDGYPHRGNVDFANNVVNPSTGTIAIRGVFQNPEPPNGRRLLSPGMFVRIRLPIGLPHQAVLVVDRAIGSDQGLKYVYVVDGQNKVQYRRVETGALQEDGLRVIRQGLSGDDQVVVGALQQVHPLMEIKPDVVEMPTPGANQSPEQSH